MNVLSVEKIAFQVADCALIVGAFLTQVAVRQAERLSAILHDQATQDLQFTRDRLAFDGRNAVREIEFLVDDFQQDAYDALATVFQLLLLLPDFYYFMVECLDHEIPVSLEADLKPMGLVKPQLTAPAIAGLLPPASTSEFTTVEVVAEVVLVEVEVAPVIQSEVVSASGSLTALVPSTTVEAVAVATLPAGWNLDKNGRKLSGAALQARMRKFNLVTA